MRASHCGQSGRSGSILCPQATEFRFCNAGALGRVPRSISACTPHGSFFRRRPPEPLLISIQTDYCVLSHAGLGGGFRGQALR